MLAELVQKKRTHRGLSMKDVAEASGGEISNGYVSLIETGKVKPANLTLKKLIVLAEVLNVSAQEVVNAALSDALRESDFQPVERILVEDLGEVGGATQEKGKRKKGGR